MRLYVQPKQDCEKMKKHLPYGWEFIILCNEDIIVVDRAATLK